MSAWFDSRAFPVLLKTSRLILSATVQNVLRHMYHKKKVVYMYFFFTFFFQAIKTVNLGIFNNQM